jgi:PAS domain S-box-containing protein
MDFTRYKRTKAPLRAAKSRNRLILDAIDEVIFGLDLEGKATFVNPAVTNLLGWQPDELLGKLPHAIIHHTRPDGSPYPQDECPIYATLKDGQAHHAVDEVFWRRDGSSFPVECTSTPILEQGELAGAVVVLRDTTEQRHLSDQIKKSEERFRDFTEVSSDYYWEMGPDLRFTYLSERFLALVGVAPGKVLGETQKELWYSIDPNISQSNQDTLHLLLITMVEHQPFSSVRFEFSLPDGQRRYFSISGKPVFDGAGNFQGYRGIGLDVTDAMLAEQAIRIAKEEAEQANMAKSEFLSSMSHELRTPMNAVLGFSQLLELEDLTESQAENVQEILKAGRHLLELINGVLDLAKIEAGRIDLSLEAITCTGLISECLTLVEPLAQQRGIGLHFDPAAQPDAVMCADFIRLKQVLLNLLSNAIKYNREAGKVTVEIATTGEDTLRLTIQDTGPGLTPEQQVDLFQSFNRLDAVNSAVEGTGIGLVISKRLVEMMGGKIGVDSTPGTGSSFWLELPRNQKSCGATP